MSSIAQPAQSAAESALPANPTPRPQAVTASQALTKEGTSSSAARTHSWIYEHWSAGIVGGLVLLESFALLVCLIDLAHFLFTGLAIGDAWALVLEKPPFEKWTAAAEAAFVFAVFFFLLPAANAGLLAVLRSLAERTANHRKQKAAEGSASQPVSIPTQPSAGTLISRWLQRASIRRGKTIWILHLLISVAISASTVLMESIQVLTGNGYTTGGSLHPSFFSLWLSVVFAVKIVTPAFFLPVARKYLVRMFGGEHPRIFEVLSEIFTEEGLKG
jgi:hypothetical protein